jgi:hypothetical protein
MGASNESYERPVIILRVLQAEKIEKGGGDV